MARSVADTIETVRRTRPDVCLIDRHFAGDNGITAIIPMLAASSRTKVLVLSADPDTEGIRQALHAGASGYLHKTRGVSALTRAIDRVQRGEVVVDVPKPVPGPAAGPAGRRAPARCLPDRTRAGMPPVAGGRPGHGRDRDQAGGLPGHGAHAHPVADDQARCALPAGSGILRGPLPAAGGRGAPLPLDRHRLSGPPAAADRPPPERGAAGGEAVAPRAGTASVRTRVATARQTASPLLDARIRRPLPGHQRDPRSCHNASPSGRCPVSPRRRLTHARRPAGDPFPCQGELCYLIGAEHGLTGATPGSPGATPRCRRSRLPRQAGGGAHADHGPGGHQGEVQADRGPAEQRPSRCAGPGRWCRSPACRPGT